MSRTSVLREHAAEAFEKVARSRYGMKCGKSPRGAKAQVCLSVGEIPGWKCGYNRINKLFACVQGKGARKRTSRKGRRGRR